MMVAHEYSSSIPVPPSCARGLAAVSDQIQNPKDPEDLVNDSLQIRAVANKEGVSEKAVMAAIAKVGPLRQKVIAELRKSKIQERNDTRRLRAARS